MSCLFPTLFPGFSPLCLLTCTFILLSVVFCVLKRKGMTTKKPEEATYFMAGNSSRILEKIQIHFEINFVSLKDSI